MQEFYRNQFVFTVKHRTEKKTVHSKGGLDLIREITFISSAVQQLYFFHFHVHSVKLYQSFTTGV